MYREKDLILGSGNSVIVTGWTIKELVFKKLQSSDYCCIGQLYSPMRGLSSIIRNLLSHPKIHQIYLLSATQEDKNAGGCECLRDFFLHGVSPAYNESFQHSWKVNSPVNGFIDGEIPISALELLRSSVESYFCTHIDGLIDRMSLTIFDQPIPWGEPLIFPESEIASPLTMPGSRYGHKIVADNIATAWVKILQLIRNTGRIRERNSEDLWQELIDLMVVVEQEPSELFFPQPNYLPCDLAYMQEYISSFLGKRTDNKTEYTYGQRMRQYFKVDQIEAAIAKLAKKPNNTNTVIDLWDSEKDFSNNNSPCLNHIWIRITEDDSLSLTAIFRSNDMFAAWPANAMGLRTLQQVIIDQLRYETGRFITPDPLIIISESAHIYGHDWQAANQVVENQYPAIFKQQCHKFDDPVGNFIIETELEKETTLYRKEIILYRTAPGDEKLIAVYKGNNAINLSRQVLSDCPSIQSHHALYLGIELARAEYAIKYCLPYTQDKGFNKC